MHLVKLTDILPNEPRTIWVNLDLVAIITREEGDRTELYGGEITDVPLAVVKETPDEIACMVRKVVRSVPR